MHYQWAFDSLSARYLFEWNRIVSVSDQSVTIERDPLTGVLAPVRSYPCHLA
jgi:hypothetical protein